MTTCTCRPFAQSPECPTHRSAVGVGMFAARPRVDPAVASALALEALLEDPDATIVHVARTRADADVEFAILVAALRFGTESEFSTSLKPAECARLLEAIGLDSPEKSV